MMLEGISKTKKFHLNYGLLLLEDEAITLRLSMHRHIIKHKPGNHSRQKNQWMLVIADQPSQDTLKEKSLVPQRLKLHDTVVCV